MMTKIDIGQYLHLHRRNQVHNVYLEDLSGWLPILVLSAQIYPVSIIGIIQKSLSYGRPSNKVVSLYEQISQSQIYKLKP